MKNVECEQLRHQSDAIGVFLVSLLLTLNIFTPCSSVSIVNFEHVIADLGAISFEEYTYSFMMIRAANFFSVSAISCFFFSWSFIK